MKLATFAPLTLLVLSGCLASPEPGAADAVVAPPFEAAPRLPTNAADAAATPSGACRGPLLQDHRSVLRGDSAVRSFRLGQPCRLAFHLDVDHVVGSLVITVSTDGKENFRAERQGVHGPQGILSVGMTTTGSRSAMLPAGIFAYRFDASDVAEFTFRVEAAR